MGSRTLRPGTLCYLAATNHLTLYQKYPLSILTGPRLAWHFRVVSRFRRHVAQRDRKRTKRARLMRTDTQWKKIGLRPHHGVNIYVLFSIHTKKSCGIGEFLDLHSADQMVQKFGTRLPPAPSHQRHGR